MKHIFNCTLSSAFDITFQGQPRRGCEFEMRGKQVRTVETRQYSSNISYCKICRPKRLCRHQVIPSSQEALGSATQNYLRLQDSKAAPRRTPEMQAIFVHWFYEGVPRTRRGREVKSPARIQCSGAFVTFQPWPRKHYGRSRA
jgi:hypothetical protein